MNTNVYTTITVDKELAEMISDLARELKMSKNKALKYAVNKVLKRKKTELLQWVIFITNTSQRIIYLKVKESKKIGKSLISMYQKHI